MLQRMEFYKLCEKIEELDPSINQMYRAYERFVSLSNLIQVSHNIIIDIELIKEAETHIRSLVNLVFINMNPEINSLIYLDENTHENYSRLSTRIEKLLEQVQTRRETFIKNLSNKSDLETNRITNKANLDFYMSFLKSICEDLIFNSLSHAYTHFETTEKPALKNIEGDRMIIRPIKNKDQELFWYIVYLHFSRLSQITVSLFTFIPKEIPIRPTEVTDINRLYFGHRLKQPEKQAFPP